MITLADATHSLEISLAEQPEIQQLAWHVTHVTLTATAMVPAAVGGLTNGAAPVTMATPPAAGQFRKICEISVHNPDTAAATVRVAANLNGTRLTKLQVQLFPGDNLLYESPSSWRVIDSAGRIKHTGGVSPDPDPDPDPPDPSPSVTGEIEIEEVDLSELVSGEVEIEDAALPEVSGEIEIEEAEVPDIDLEPADGEIEIEEVDLSELGSGEVEIEEVDLSELGSGEVEIEDAELPEVSGEIEIEEATEAEATHKYDMEEGNGSLIEDTGTTATHHGTLSGSVAFNADSAAGDWALKFVDGVVNFNGALGVQSFTVEMMLKTTSTEGNSGVVLTNDSGSNDFWAIAIGHSFPDSVATWTVEIQDNFGMPTVHQFAAPAGYVTVRVAYDAASTTIRIWVDDQLELTEVEEWDFDSSGNFKLQGEVSNGGDGTLVDELKIWHGIAWPM